MTRNTDDEILQKAHKGLIRLRPITFRHVSLTVEADKSKRLANRHELQA